VQDGGGAGGQPDLVEPGGHLRRIVENEARVAAERARLHRRRVVVVDGHPAPDRRPEAAGRDDGREFLEGAPDLGIGAGVGHGRNAARGLVCDIDGEHGRLSFFVSQPFGDHLAVLPERRRRTAVPEREGAGEAPGAAVARPSRDLLERQVALHEPDGCPVQPDAPDCLRCRLPRHRVEDAVPVEARHRRDIGQRVERQVARRVVVDVVEHPKETLLVVLHVPLLTFREFRRMSAEDKSCRVSVRRGNRRPRGWPGRCP
jgi:hypothetical protein